MPVVRHDSMILHARHARLREAAGRKLSDRWKDSVQQVHASGQIRRSIHSSSSSKGRQFRSLLIPVNAQPSAGSDSGCNRLRCSQFHVDMHGIERANDSTAFGSLEQAQIAQDRDVIMDSTYITRHLSSQLTH